MPSDRPESIARNYLTPPSDSFWAWTDDGSGVVWVDGQPIATSKEIEAVLARLAPRGLPPFGAVVLLLASCQADWKAHSTGQGTLAAYTRSLKERRETHTGKDTAIAIVNQLAQRWQGVVRGLDAVGVLPADLRERADNKAVIAEILFEESNLRTSPDAGAVVVSELARGIPGRALIHDNGALAVFEAFLGDIEALKPGLASLSEEHVRQRLMTGVDFVPRAPELELPPSERVRRLIAGLVTDRELAGLGRLAQRLVAAVHVPRQLSQPEELPLGGVSDLSNRGPLERLLISELAHDDLTLAVRVALNEALYLRRETPPRSPPERRCILIDAGLRMWGAPRLFGAAVALALAATADRRATLEVHRAHRGGVRPVDTATRDGMLLHLEALEHTAHPGSALAPWLEALAKGNAAGEMLSDLVLVTHDEVLDDPEFHACLPALGTDLYVATVNREGQFRLVLLTRTGRRPICSAKLSLDEILEPQLNAAAQQVLRQAAGEDARLPLILTVQPFPLLMPAHVRPEHVALDGTRGAVAVTKDGRLLHWRLDARGARELTAQVPRGKVADISVLSDGTAEVLVRRESGDTAALVRADLATGAVRFAELVGALPPSVIARRQAESLLLFSRGRVDAFDPGTGQRFATLATPGARWVGSRFFQNAGAWYTVSFDGHEVGLSRVNGASAGTLALFERQGLDGPWGITDGGRVYSTASGTLVMLSLPFATPLLLERISRDGHRLVVRPRTGPQTERYLLDLERGEARRVYGAGIIHALEPQVHAALSRIAGSVRRNLRGVAVGADGSLLLVAPDARCLAIQQGNAGQLELRYTGLALGGAKTRAVQPELIPFRKVPGPRETHVTLSEAVFAEGSRAFLDGRGLLHLKSSDRTLAEVSLVLSDLAVAAWTSAGHACGPKYFLGELPVSEPHAVWEDLQRIVRRLR